MRRRLLGNRRSGGTEIGNSWSLDTLPEDYSAPLYLVRRESDNATLTISRNDVHNGVYENWLNGSEGRVLEWYGEVDATIHPTSALEIYQFKLLPNTDYLDGKHAASISGVQPLEMDKDYIITYIVEREMNANNQRCSFSISGGNGKRLTVDLRSNGAVYITFDTMLTSVLDFQFTIPTTYVFKLLTFHRINGVFNMMMNNANLTPVTPQDWNVRSYINDYEFTIGGRAGTDPGKQNFYKHLGIKTGEDLSDIDISEHNLSIMSKYGI